MLNWKAQLELCAAYWRHPEVGRELAGVLRPSHFENPALGWICKIVTEESVGGGVATEGQVFQALTKLEPHMQAACLSLLPDVQAADDQPTEQAVKNGRLFAAHQEAMILSGELPRLAREGLYDQVRNRLQDVLALAAPLGGTVTTPVTEEAVRERQTRVHRVIPTGLGRLDTLYLPGGACRGQSYHVLAKKSAGKGQTMVSLGAVALLAGLRVDHVTLEDPVWEVQARYDRSITGLPAEKLVEVLSSNLETLRDCHNRLRIIDGRRRGFSVASLQSSLDKARGGLEPDLVIVDYMQRVASGHKFLGGDFAAGRRAAISQVSQDLDAIAAERDVVLWVPYQCNREGVKKMWGPSKGLLDVTDYAECYEAAYPPAGIISINRSLTEEGTRYGKIYLAEHRMGVKNKVVEATLDWAVSRARDALDEKAGGPA